jgi:hypothetical protein
VEALFRRRHVKFELREVSPEEFSYDAVATRLEDRRVSAEIMALDPDPGTAVQWNRKEEKGPRFMQLLFNPTTDSRPF